MHISTVFINIFVNNIYIALWKLLTLFFKFNFYITRSSERDKEIHVLRKIKFVKLRVLPGEIGTFPDVLSIWGTKFYILLTPVVFK